MDPTLAAEEPAKTSDSLLASMFGVTAKDQAKKRLGATPFLGKMSITDVNELASQAEYDSLFPNLGVNFFDREFYGPKAAGDFVKDLSEIEVDAIDTKAQLRIDNVVLTFNARMDPSNAQYDEAFAERMKAEGYTSVDAAEDAKEAEIGRAARAIVDTTVGLYGQTGLFDHEPSVNLMKRIMGEEYVLNQMRELGLMPDEEDTEDNTTATLNAEADASSLEDLMSTPEGDTDDSQPEETTQTETTQTEAPDTEAQKEALLAKTFPKRPSGLSAKRVGWDRDYEGKVDPKSGKVIIAPPRPADGGEKTKTVRNENVFGIRQGADLKLTEAEYWDRTYGETHDPTSGLPFGYETLLED
jgi:hypothetical protein